MPLRLRRFLLMLLLLAVPSHALASAAMLACGVGHAAPHAAHAASATDVCHDHGGSDVPQSLPECEHCAACALASALPVQFSKGLPWTDIAGYNPSQPAAPFSGFIPDGPERPPRNLLA